MSFHLRHYRKPLPIVQAEWFTRFMHAKCLLLHIVYVVGQRFPPLYLVGIFIFGEKPGVLNKNTSRAQHSISAINIFCAIYVHFCAHSIVDLVTCMGAVKYLCSFTCCTCS